MTLTPESLRLIAACKGVEQAVFHAVEAQYALAEIRSALSDVPVGEIVRSWLHCFRIPLQSHGDPHHAWALGQVADLLYLEGEEIEGLTLGMVFQRFTPWLRAS
jgi:hypothetical protein